MTDDAAPSRPPVVLVVGAGESTGGAIAKPAVEPLRPREPCARTEREPAQALDHAAVDLSGPARVIVHGVARKYGLKTCDLTGPRQSRAYAYPRHEAMARIREVFPAPLGPSSPKMDPFGMEILIWSSAR